LIFNLIIVIMIIYHLTCLPILPDNTYLFLFEWEYFYYKGYKSQLLNNIVNVLTAPFYCIHCVCVCFIGNILIVLPQIFFYSPIIIIFGFHWVLKKIDDWLVPLVGELL